MKYSIGLGVNSEGNREVYIETDDLQSVVSMPWFQMFLKLKVVETSDDVVRKLSEENFLLQQRIMDLRKQTQTPLPSVPQPPKFDDQIQAIAPELMQTLPQQPVQSARQRLPNSFLDITTDMMTNSIWAQFNPEQQEAWLKKYYPNRVPSQ